MIYQTIIGSRISLAFVVGGVYVLTILLILFIYASRLYTNRSVLAGIPKSYIPIESGEVGKSVRRMIVKSLERSAIIAWDSRPRDVREDPQARFEAGTTLSTAERVQSAFTRSSHISKATIVPIDAKSPPWGHVAHPGWASPSSEDLPNLHFWTVILELPNLIEAKAVSLAPADPAFDMGGPSQDQVPPLPDARVVALLQRPAMMGLRDYFAHLSWLGLINPPTLGETFLAKYEYARFSTDALTEPEFRSLVAVFAEILSGMTELDPAMIADVQQEELLSEAASLASSDSPSSSGASAIRYQTPRPDNFSALSEDGSLTSRRPRSGSTGTVRTAPSRSRNMSEGIGIVPRTPSAISLASARKKSYTHGTPDGLASSPSLASLRSAQSVIRHTPNLDTVDLP